WPGARRVRTATWSPPTCSTSDASGGILANTASVSSRAPADCGGIVAGLQPAMSTRHSTRTGAATSKAVALVRMGFRLIRAAGGRAYDVQGMTVLALFYVVGN